MSDADRTEESDLDPPVEEDLHGSREGREASPGELQVHRLRKEEAEAPPVEAGRESEEGRSRSGEPLLQRRREEAHLEGLQQRLGAEFQGETEKFNKALRDSIQHFLAVYNKDKKYSLILTKQGDNILYGDKALDITTQVVAGLNKAYKKTDLSKSSSKDEKKK